MSLTETLISHFLGLTKTSAPQSILFSSQQNRLTIGTSIDRMLGLIVTTAMIVGGGAVIGKVVGKVRRGRERERGQGRGKEGKGSKNGRGEYDNRGMGWKGGFEGGEGEADFGMSYILAIPAAINNIANLIFMTIWNASQMANQHKKYGKRGSEDETCDANGDAYFNAVFGKEGKEAGEKIKHTGSCHCGGIGFEVLAPPKLHTYDCPSKLRYPHLPTSSSSFTLTKGADNFLAIYYVTLPTGKGGSAGGIKAAHGFCRRCGVHVFRAPSPNVDCIEVNVNCFDGGTASDQIVKFYSNKIPTAMGRGIFAGSDNIVLDTKGGDQQVQKRNTPVFSRRSGGGFESLATLGGGGCAGGGNANSIKTLEQTQTEKLLPKASFGISTAAAIAKEHRPSPIKVSKRPPLHNRTNLRSFTVEEPSSALSSQYPDGCDDDVKFSSSPKTTQLLYQRAQQKMDTPLKIQMQYYLSRHLSESREEIALNDGIVE